MVGWNVESEKMGFDWGCVVGYNRIQVVYASREHHFQVTVDGLNGAKLPERIVMRLYNPLILEPKTMITLPIIYHDFAFVSLVLMDKNQDDDVFVCGNRLVNNMDRVIVKEFYAN